ncbi:uncharacterized protein LOC128682129 [Plodia interpunctella]|uniref:uncharacterized protein LOC128682129 n=1 Tax=Plodia interpunctella TaxID=58824 RepID=UPI0023687B61|nr:uncharacterized protein LOC128682129 [Plodia interpunctella]
MLILKLKMSGLICAALCLLSFIVLTVSGAKVFLIDAKSNSGDVHRLSLSSDKKSLVLEPVTSDDALKAEAEQIYELYKRPNIAQLQLLSNKHRIFGNMFGNSNLKSYVSKKYKTPRYDLKHQMKSLEPIIKYILSQKKANTKYTFQDLTRKEKPGPFAEDYVDFGDFGRHQAAPDFSQDYIDFRFTRDDSKRSRLRRATDVVQEALRSYVESDSDEDDDEDTKSKRFEVVKNKNNKKDIKNESDASEEKGKERKNVKKSNELDSDEDFSELSKEKKPAKVKPKKESVENNIEEKPEMYLQGNKLTVYPRMHGDSVEADSNEDSRRSEIFRRMRLPYFLPKRYHWTPKDVPNLGYFFFNGPKGVSQESD